MALASAAAYSEMLITARDQSFALPGVAGSSSETLNAALRGFADAESDGIIQVSPSAASYASGTAIDSMVNGALALAGYVQALADRYSIQIALHTDHCPFAQLDSFFIPLLDASSSYREVNGRPLFNSQMFDGSDLPLNDNLRISSHLLEQASSLDVVLEIEVGVVGRHGGGQDQLETGSFTSPGDFIEVVRSLGDSDRGQYLLAPAFGNVHGPSAGKHRIEIDVLRQGQAAVSGSLQTSNPVQLAFHGGSGCSTDLIREAIKCGVVKFNVDTDTQYAYSHALAEYMREHYSDVVGEVDTPPLKAAFDSRSYGRRGEVSMAAKVREICERTGSAGHSIGRE
jgi:fructose-bisphosphate aldolase class II